MANTLRDVYQSMAVDGAAQSPLAIGSMDLGDRAYKPSYEVDEQRNNLVATAASFKDLMLENAEEINKTRRVPDGVIDALADAGLFKLTVPKRYGGHETDVGTIIDIAATLAESCGVDSMGSNPH